MFVVEPEDVKAGLRPREVYREPGDHWFMGIAPRGEDLYVAKHDAVLVLPGAVRNRGPVVPRPIVWGFPRAKGWAFHQTLHDLKVGPDGKLYFSMGDPAWSFGDFRRPDHWFRTRIETAGSAGPARHRQRRRAVPLRPAGRSNLELVMTGTRNNNGFDWNRDFDLFTTDNDHEQDSRYVPSRLLFVVEGGFYNWPRGWMEDRPENLPAVAGMGREVPVGLAVYEDSRLPAGYRGNVLVARWGKQAIDRFIPRRDGGGIHGHGDPLAGLPAGPPADGRGGRPRRSRLCGRQPHGDQRRKPNLHRRPPGDRPRRHPHAARSAARLEPATASVDELYPHWPAPTSRGGCPPMSSWPARGRCAGGSARGSPRRSRTEVPHCPT